MADPCATSIASNPVSKLGEYLFVPIKRQFGYVLCHKRYVEDLKKEAGDLKNARERVQGSIDKAMYEGKPIHIDVNDWLKTVEKEAEEAENLLRDGESAKNACFRGWLPNPVLCHPFGRKVKKMTRVIQELHMKSNFMEVHYENPPIGIVTATTSTARGVHKNEDVLLSRASIMEDVMKAIASDNVHVIGVYGPGGVGKSKLMEDIQRRVKEENLFDVVAMANVSRNPDIGRIQEKIADDLGLKIKNEKTCRGRADILHRRLESDNKEKILIILDNLWMKLELKEIGIPCGYDNKIRGCKLLLTSRFRNVLCVDMGSDWDSQLNELKHEEARRLFERIVGEKVHDPVFQNFVDRVVVNCGGLPLFIVSLAKQLKHGDLSAWKNAWTIEESDIKTAVQLNYNDLKDPRIRSLFLVCALASGRIPMRDSLVYCIGLGLFKKFSKTIENARNRLMMDLQSLQECSLLLDCGEMERFTMHAIFVDTALHIASDEWNTLVGRKDYGFEKWSEDELSKCTVISFRNVGIDRLPEKLNCPNLRMLLLYEENPSLKIPESLFESMVKLQVLDFTRLSFTTLPSSIEFLENLKTLCLDFCHLDDVTVIGKLKGLQFLSFLDSKITRLPKQIGELTELRFLDLTGCTRLKVVEPGVLGSLVNLEELYMEDSFDQWEAEDEAPRSNANLDELKSLKNLSTLSIAIPRSVNLSRDLPFGKLNRHKIQIGDVWDWSDKFKESRTLKIELYTDNLLLEEWVQRCFKITQDLHLDGLQGGNDSIHDLCIGDFKELKHLHVQNSLSFQYVVHSKENVQCTAFTSLESLFLENLNNLKKICHGCLAPESFSKLKIVKVDCGGEIKHLFPLSMMRIFLQLEEIEISGCHLMQQIITNAKADEDGDEIDDDPKKESSNLRRLTLRNLPEMTSLCKTVERPVIFFNEQEVSLPLLESLTLSELPKLKEIWNSQSLSDVSNLKFLKVEDCMFLSSIIPSNLLINVQNLEAITIERCQLIRELFNLEGLAATEDVEILSKLIELTLSDLPSLGRIWNKNPRRVSFFQNLRTLRVQNCENLRFLFSSSMAKALGQIQEIAIAYCELMEEIMDVQEEELEEAAITNTLEFPLLTSLSLEELPNLRTFSYGKFYIYCPSLTRLWISGCPKMMTFSSLEGKRQLEIADTGLQQAFGHINSGLSWPVFFHQNVFLPNLEELTLLSLCGLRRIWHDELPGESFCKLASITVRDCENLSHIFPSILIERFRKLKVIEVVECASLGALIEHATSNTKAMLGLPSLTNVSLIYCHSLKYLFTNDTASTLDKLEMLDVSSCDNIREVVVAEECEQQKMKAVKFSHLRTLKLYSLKSLISFSSGSCAYEFPSLRNLSILECNELKTFIVRPPKPREEMTNEGAAGFDEGSYSLFDKKVIFSKLEEPRLTGIQSREFWENEMPDESICFHSLTTVRVEKCPRLRNLFTMSMAKSLGQLQYLGLGGCGEMEYIVAREEEKPKEAADIIVIPQLVTLYLHNMPKLRSFCHGKHISEFPSLKEFNIENCKAVEVILEDANYRRLEGSISTEQPLLLIEKVEFPCMESMKISHMDNLEKIWLDQLDSNGFSTLKMLIVEYCEKLSSVLSSNTILARFQNLKELTVTDCGSLEVVFQVQQLNTSGAPSTSSFELRELNLTRLPKMKHVWGGLPYGALTYGHLRCVRIFKCESLKSLFPSSVAKSMTQLKELMISSCGVEEIIVEEDQGIGKTASFFPRLATLKLLELPELRSFHKNSHTSTWPLLKELQVKRCGKMRSFSLACEIQGWQGTSTSMNQPAVFSVEKVIPHLEQLTFTRENVEMMQHDNFGNLRQLIVDYSSFEEIFPKGVFGHEGPCEGLFDMEKPLKAFENLKRLQLINLCNLRQLWNDGFFMAKILKHIESLSLCRCPSLSIVFLSPTSFPRLTELEVMDCTSLVHLGTCSAMTSLVHLTRLILRYCGAMKDVVTDDGNGAEISFPKLEELILDGLPSLESFSLTNCTFIFPSLVRIIVMQCPKMQMFCNGSLRTPKLDKVLFSNQDDEGRWEDDLNTTIQTLSA